MGLKLRWGILGCAAIARRALVPAIHASETGELAAVASRSPEKARQFASECDIPRAYGSYEELLADAEIDAVYIPLPNHLHAPWTVRAAQAGKHVLCEKPLAMDAGEARAMVEACERAGVKLAEAFMYRYHPRYERVRSLLEAGEIGEVRGVNGHFTFNNAGAEGNVRFDRAMGGGSLYDVGCYAIDSARYLLGREPVAATAHAFFSRLHDGVDMYAAGLLEFGNGLSAAFDCGMWAGFRNRIEIVGADGRIEIPHAFLYPSAADARFTVHTRDGVRTEPTPDVNQYTLQVDSFGLSVLFDAPLRFAPDWSVRNMRVIDACLRSARNGERVVLA